MLHGRATERARLDALVDQVAGGRGAALLVTGPAGIGKTALLDEAATAAAAAVRVLRTTGHEAEAGVPYAALHALLGPLLALREQLPDAARAALESAFALGGDAGPPDDGFAVPRAVRALVGEAADDAPLLLVADDVHWLDDASRDALLFLARDVEATGAGLLLASRDGAELPFDPGGIGVLALEPLGRDAALAVLGEDADLAPEVAERLLDAGAGNPLALRELPRGLSDDERRGRAAPAAPAAAGAGGAVQAAVAQRLERLPEATRRALCVLAAGTPVEPRALAAALGRLGLDPAALAEAEAAGVVAAGAFAHPLFAAAAYHGEPSSTRRDAHRALAEVSAQPRRAWHLAAAATGPDAGAAAALADAAELARGRGAHAEAARALRRAAELTEDPGARVLRELEAARELLAAGDPAGAGELAARVAAAGDPVLEGQARHVQARVLMLTGAPGDALALLGALERTAAAAGDHATAAALALEASTVHMQSGDLEALLENAQRGRAHAEAVSPELAMVAALVAGEALVALGRAAEGEPLLTAAEPLLFGGDPRAGLHELLGMGAMCSVWTERFDRAERTLEHLVGGPPAGRAPRRGSPTRCRCRPSCCGGAAGGRRPTRPPRRRCASHARPASTACCR